MSHGLDSHGFQSQRFARRRGVPRFASLALSVFAAIPIACAKAPEVERPALGVDVPAQWSATEASSTSDDVSERWWQEFSSDALDRIVVAALSGNQDLRVASARIESALAQAAIRGADGLPTLNAGLDGNRTQRNFIGFPIPGGGDVLTTRSTSFSTSLAFSWELDLWGRIRAGRSAALADVQAARADAYAARLSLTGQAAKLWFRVLESRSQLELATRSAASFQSTRERVEDRYRRGVRPSVDVRLAASNVAAAEASVEIRREATDRLARRLEVLLGEYPGAKLAIDAALPELPASIPAFLPTELIARRPDLAAAERRLAATGARIDEARRALYPRFSLTTSAGTSSSELSDLVNGNFGVWSLAAGVAQPVFQGGRILAGIDLAESHQRESLALYVSTALDAFREVESALSAERVLEARERAQRTAADEARAASGLAEGRYTSGLDTLLPVLEAQRRAFDNESRLLEARRARLENRVDLYLALGGGFRRDGVDTREPARHDLETRDAESDAAIEGTIR